MSNPNLNDYISNLRSTGASDDSIKHNLVKAGWPEDEVSLAMNPVVPLPPSSVPTPTVPRFGMWISFEYILLFITLWIWTAAVGGIWNYGIDRHIPDPLANYESSYFGGVSTSLLQGYLAAIIVAYPFFMALFISLNKQIGVSPAIRNIKTRKILMYLTIIVNFLVMIYMMITTLIGYLGATASTRTIPHLLVSLIISGSICVYLLKAMNEDRKIAV